MPNLESVKRQSSSGGFSALELAVVIIIVGLLMVPIYSLMFRILNVQTINKDTNAILHGVSEYVRVYGYFPCPASLTAAPGDAYYDEEARASTNAACDTSALVSVDSGTVFIGALPARTLTEAMGCAEDPTATDNWVLDLLSGNLDTVLDRRADGDPNLDTSNSGRAAGVMSCIDESYALDRHGHKFVYAVAAPVTQLGGYDPTDASDRLIQIVDVSGTVASNQFAVVVSMGEDAKGAYRQDGTAFPLACSGSDLDVENCDLSDAVFRDMPYTDGTQFFDDVINFSIAGLERENKLWNWSGNTVSADGATDDRRHMTFKENSRLILSDPSTTTAGAIDANDLLVVEGANMRVDGGNVTSTNEVVAPRFCYSDACDGSGL